MAAEGSRACIFIDFFPDAKHVFNGQILYAPQPQPN